MSVIMRLEVWSDMERLKKRIKACEGHHIQQVAYSSYHDALTQVCFYCKKVRTTLKGVEGEK